MLHRLWNEGQLCDLILRAHPAMEDGEQDGAGEPVEVKMHANVAAQSETIEKMLSGQFKESRRDVPIDLPPEHVDAASLRSVVSVLCMPS